MSTVFEWLDRASSCGDPTVEQAARVMKDYYQGAEPDHDWAGLRDRFKDHPHVHEAGPHECSHVGSNNASG